MSVTSKDFVGGLYKTVVEEGMAIYGQLFAITEMAIVTDEYWKRALALYQQLDESQREVFIGILRQVTVDTVSSVLAVIDGSTAIGPGQPAIELVADGNSIHGDLQNLFLGMEKLGL